MQCIRVSLVSLLISVCGLSGAEALEISPIKLTIGTQEGQGTFKIKNSKSGPVLYKSEIFRWSVSSDSSSLSPTNDLIVFPPIFELQPNEEQVIRVALRNSSDSNVEETYRLVATEIPSEVDTSEGISFQFRVNVPIFVSPDGAQAQPNWRLDKLSGGKTQLVLMNKGDAHMKIGRMNLIEPVDQKSLLSIQSIGYVFAGEERSWLLDRSSDDLEGAFVIETETDEGPTETAVSFTES